MAKKYTLDDDDIAVIKTAIQIAQRDSIRIWEQKILDPIKKKIKAALRGLLNERCCYCCRNTLGEFSMVLDIEHILPKSKYKRFEFSPFNLSVSCKRCNMPLKGDNSSFLVDEKLAKKKPRDIANYKFIHPNLEDYFIHIEYNVVIKNDKKLIKYRILNDSSKGRFTYDFFDLKKLECDSLNEAQGIKRREKRFSDLIPHEIVSEIEDLLGK